MKLIAITPNYLIRQHDNGVFELEFITTNNVSYSRFFPKVSVAIEMAGKYGSVKHSVKFLRSKLGIPLYDYERAQKLQIDMPVYVQTSLGYTS